MWKVVRASCVCVYQVAALDMYSEKNTGTNLPAQIEIYATPGNEYHFLFIAKGGGSANKSYLFQQTKALLTPETLLQFIGDKIKVGICFELTLVYISLYIGFHMSPPLLTRSSATARTVHDADVWAHSLSL